MRSHSRGSGLPRIVAVLLSTILICVTTETFAYNFSAVNEDGVSIYYNYINNTEAEVTSGESAYSGTVNIPKTVEHNGETLNVTSIGDRAFYYCLDLTSVTIGESVTSIGDRAFYYCSSLTSVTIGKSVTRIGDYAFWDCSSLTSIDIPSFVTSIGYLAFGYCSGLTSVTIGNSVTSIGDRAFYYCTGLTSVTIGNSVTRIGDYAFWDCSSLTEVTLQGTTLPECGAYAFYGISSGATVYCAPKLEATCKITAPWLDFDSIYPLVTLTSEERLSNYITDDIKNTVTKLKVVGEINSEDISLMAEMAGKDNSNGQLGILDLSEATTASADLIGNAAFECCGKLTSISLPIGVKSIGEYAFIRCSNLTSVTIPNSVTSIGEGAFEFCGSLPSVTIPNSVTNIGDDAFGDCHSLTSINIPASVTSINQYTFSACPKLTSITIPNSITSIGEGAFKFCRSLTSVTIPNSVTNIGEGAFAWCSNLTEVTLQGTTMLECDATAFDQISSDATLYCKAALIEICKDIAPWNNFNIVVNPFTIEITDAGIATGCFDDDLDFSGLEVKAYIASGFNPKTGKVLMTNVTEVPAGTGFIVKGTEGTYEIPAVATKYMYANMLVGTLENTTLPKTDEDTYTYYVLGKDAEDKAGFFLADDGCPVPANKAYLQIPTSAVATTTSNVKSSLSIGFDDEDGTITGIAPVKTVEEEMDGNTVIYNINGQRMQSLTRGLNIVNGKKIFIK